MLIGTFPPHARLRLRSQRRRRHSDQRASARRHGAEPAAHACRCCSCSACVLAIPLALLVAFFRETYIDRTGVFLCVLAMSVSILLYIIGAQYLIGKLLRWFPISGFDPDPRVVLRFLALPVLVGVVASVGARRALLSHGLRRGDQPRLRAHRARQGLRRGARDDAPRAAQRADPDAHADRARDPVPVHGLAAARVLLRHSRARLASPSTRSTATTSRRLRTMVYIGSLLFILGQILTDL